MLVFNALMTKDLRVDTEESRIQSAELWGIGLLRVGRREQDLAKETENEYS